MWVWVRSEGENESEDKSEKQGDAHRLPHRHTLIHTHTLAHPPPLKNTITRRRIKFCIQHNQLDSQHSFTREYQQEILESAANFSYVFC